MADFAVEDYTRAVEIEGMASAPKGKPSPEVKAKLDEQKKLRVEFCVTMREKYGLEGSVGDKKIMKDMLAVAAAAAEAAKAADKDEISLQPPSGTRDMYPERMRLQMWLFEQFRSVAHEMGFQEYDAPVLESTKLYQRKAGEEITEQMYNFTDKEGAEVTLRPEMTPSLARMVLGTMQSETGEIKDLLPFKWFSIPQCWRFETTQRGRKREHYQWNMDIVGPQTDKSIITAEVELLAAIVAFFKRLKVTSADVGIKVNSRKVLASILTAYGVNEEQFAPVCVVVDKLDKIGPEAVKEELLAIQVPPESADKILAVLAAKSVEEMEALVKDANVNSDAIAELRELFSLCEAYGIADWLIFDASVVRGLAYYTGVVWEAFDRLGELRAICGGGRYDRLLTLYGATKPVPCVGFGFGDCVIIELLKDKGLMPDLPRVVDYVVAAYDKDTYGPSCMVAAKLREAGSSVDMLLLPEGKKVKKAFDYANRAGAHRMAFVGPDEWANGKLVRIKDLRKTDGDKDDKGVDVPFDSLEQVDGFLGKRLGAQNTTASGEETPSTSLDSKAMERCGKAEEWLLEHDFRSVMQQCVSQVVLNQSENPYKELAELLLTYAPAEAPAASTAETESTDC